MRMLYCMRCIAIRTIDKIIVDCLWKFEEAKDEN